MNAFKAFEYELLIVESHLDTFGHVNNATYLEIMEEARWDLLTQRNFGLDVIRKLQIGPIVLGIEIKFLRELKNRTPIKIVSQVTEYSGKISKMKQSIVAPDGALACEALFTFGLFDMQKRKLIDPTTEWLKAVGQP